MNNLTLHLLRLLNYNSNHVSLLSKDDERPPSEAGPPPPKMQETQKQEQVSLLDSDMLRAPKEGTLTQNQKDEVPLALRGVLVG